jgi:hypothetical protein
MGRWAGEVAVVFGGAWEVANAAGALPDHRYSLGFELGVR